MKKHTPLIYTEGAKNTNFYDENIFPELPRQVKENRTNVLQTINFTSHERKKI